MKKTNKDKIRIGGRIPEELKLKVDAYIDQTGMKVQVLLKQAIELFLDKNTK